MHSSPHVVFLSTLLFTLPLWGQNPTVPSRGQSAELNGIVLFNAYYNDDLVNDRGVPWLASPRNPFAGDPLEAVGSTISQTRLSVSGWATDVLGGYVEGEIDLDFFAAQSDGDRPKAAPRIRRAVATVRWSHAWLTFGREALLISPFDPSTYSMIAVPGFTGSGNLSRWMPQVRLGADVGGTFRLGIEAAAVAPRFEDLSDDFNQHPDFAEQSKRPFVQGRLLSRWGDHGTGGEIGVGGHYGWFVQGVDSLGITRAGTFAARILLGRLIEIRAEGFVGEGLGMLGAGAVEQTLAPDGTPVRSRGGWAQLNIHPVAGLEIGGGYGVDDPEDDDLDAATGRRMNVNWELHGHAHAGNLVFAVEYRRLETTYSDIIYDLQTANHVNLALGFEF